MKFPRILLAILVLALAATATRHAQAKTGLDEVCGRTSEYGCYTNHKYGFVAAWPTRFLTPQGESDSGDGQAFASKDGRAAMACWAFYSAVNGQSLKQAFQEASDEGDAQVTYKRLGKDYFVVSGIKDGKIFYRKTMDAGGVRASFELSYDPALKQAFDPVVKDVARSFTVDWAFAWGSGQ